MLIEPPILNLDLAAKSGRNSIDFTRNGLCQREILLPIRTFIKPRTRRADAFSDQQHDICRALSINLQAVSAVVCAAVCVAMNIKQIVVFLSCIQPAAKHRQRARIRSG